MPIRFTALGGPLDGQTFEYAKSQAAITIGRLEDRDIRFPADFRAVSRAHLTIVGDHDRYYLRPDQAVFVDGREAMRDDELPRRCELRLGSPAGPGFSIEWSILSDMPSTQAPVKRPARLNPVREAMRATARARRMAIAAAGLVLLVGAGVLAHALLQPEPIRDRLAAARQSVYLVVLRNEAGRELNGATAWVIAPGVLATNAHVVAAVAQQKQRKWKAFVRANFPPYETHEITEAIAHPHYERHANFIKQYVPVGADGRVLTLGPSYDVGLLRVSSTAKLAPPLKVAETGTLHRLAAGDEIGYIGYPSERMTAGGVNVTQPTPQTHIATITAVTDYFLSEARPEERHLIQHSLVTAGGSSGSPVFNRRGEVIAVHNAGNYAVVQNIRLHSIQIGYAQRADLVGEILDVKLEAIVLARDDAWKKRFSTLPSMPVHLAREFQRETNTDGAKPVLDAEVGLARIPDVSKPAALVEFHIPGPGKLLFLAVGEYPGIVQLHVADAADRFKVSSGKPESVHYAWVKLDAAEEKKVTIMVLGNEPGRKIALRVYFVPKKS